MNTDTLISWNRDFPHVSKLKDLKRITISPPLNRLVPADFAELAHLEEITLAPELEEMKGLGNRSELALPSGFFAELRELRHLNVIQKGLTALLPDTFRGLSRLQSLNLQGNRIRRLEPGAFRGLSALTALVLDHNALEKLGAEELRDLPSLMQLSIVGNSLREITPGAFAWNPLLTVLNLQHNRLHDLVESVLADTLSVAVQLDGNPLSAAARQHLTADGSRLHLV